MNILAIDPGLKGGWALNDEDADNGITNIATGVMPLMGHMIDVWPLAELIREYDVEKVYVEAVHSMPAQGVCSVFKFGTGFGQLLGLCQTLQVPYQLVTPQAWKKEVLAGTPKDKNAAIETAHKLFPAVNLIQKGCRTPHDGVADALMILRYAMIKEGLI